jgi:D-lactate dehydrogenase
MSTQPEALRHLLRRSRCFAGLDDSTIDLLASRMAPATYAPEETLCREGDDATWMFVVARGEISVLKDGDDGIAVELSALRAGDIGGEISLFGSHRRGASLVARSQVDIWRLDHGTFDALLGEHPVLARALLARLSELLAHESSVVAKLLAPGLDRRLKVAFFDAKPYMKRAFTERNQYNYNLQFFDSRLTPQTASLAAGHEVVCVFVNDVVDESVVRDLAALGVEHIALRCAGYNNVDLAACEHCGIAVTRVPAYSPYAVAEHAVALMLTLNRRVHRAHSRVRDGNFSLDGFVGFDMHGRTAGVVGAGKIGQCLLRILHGFGCELLAYDRSPNAELSDQLGVRFVELPELIAASDIISLHAPLLPATHHLINDQTIAAMKPGVMLINTSRGALVDTEALIKGLKSGQIGAAGLDVYEEEREYFFEDRSDDVLADDVLARLLTFNNVIVTSHQAFLTEEALENIADTTLGNVRELETGTAIEQLTNRVAVG